MKIRFLLWICLLFIRFNANAQLSGYVRDNYSLPVANAILEFINEKNPSIKFSTQTNNLGYYNLPVNSINQVILLSTLYKASPNPFYYSTTISFFLKESGKTLLSVYNTLGQRIRILENSHLATGTYEYSWDGTLQNGQRVVPGMYFIVLESSGKRFSEKVILLKTSEIAAVGSFHELKSLETESYQVIITGADIDTFYLSNIIISPTNQLDFNVFRRVSIPFSTVNDYLGKWNGTNYDPIFIKGMNLGVSIPGTLPGELAATRDQYTRWINKIGEAGFNAIRLYTLHYPRFYEELALYNNSHPNKPIYLFQGIWLQEDTLNGNLYHYTDSFDVGIKEVIDCIHGHKTIGERYGRAFGNYTVDVSRWTIGYITGREIYPYEVKSTNFLNSDKVGFDGDMLRLSTGSPTETWLAGRLNGLISYEKQRYKMQHPVSASSWPTLDPINHPSEPDDLTDEDVESFDLQNIDMFNAPAGYFASFHAYPYYPDFVNRDLSYKDVQDNEGPNAYLGYLQDLKKHYSGKPLIIAEYGVPSSWGNAHTANSGMNHGGHTEVEQGEMDIRLLKTIRSAGCGGGMLFSWIDEWFKRTWLFDPIKSAPDRMPLWHSIASAEENFGMIAFDPAASAFQPYQLTGNPSRITSVSASADAVFFHLKIKLSSALLSTDSLWIGLDTYNSSVGESKLPNGVSTTNRSEFALLIKNDSAKLMVTKAYDLFGIWFIRNNAFPEQLFHSIATDGEPCNMVRLKNNFEDTAVQVIGKLKVRKNGNPVTSLDAVYFDNNEINIQIPWHYLNFTDPSALLVMDDNRSTSIRETSATDGIALTLSIGNEKITTDRFLWQVWNIAPTTTEREKSCLEIIKSGNSEIEDSPPND